MRITTMLAAAALIGVSAGAVLAQAQAGKDAFKYTAPADIATTLEKHNATGLASSPIATYSDFSGVQVDRIKSGRVETHDKWTDFIVVLDGKGSFAIGGTVQNNAKNPNGQAGEWLGDSSSGSQAYDMAPGATFIVPAGIPHQMQVPAGGHVRYIAFKRPAS